MICGLGYPKNKYSSFQCKKIGMLCQAALQHNFALFVDLMGELQYHIIRHRAHRAGKLPVFFDCFVEYMILFLSLQMHDSFFTFTFLVYMAVI